MTGRGGKLLALAALLTLAALLSFLIGRYPIDPGTVLKLLGARVLPIAPDWTDRVALVFYNVRLPRVALAMMVGAGLSAAGAAYQGVFQNPMASPDVLGASSGAGLGAAVAILHGLSRFGVSAAAFGGGLIAVCIVMGIGRRAGIGRVMTLILSGIMVSSLMTAATSYVKLLADPSDQLPAITFWLMGSLAGATTRDLVLAAVPMGIGLLGLMMLRWKLNLLTLGDDEARALGVNAPRLRLMLVACATLTTAAAVSVCGVIGWVGLVVPHLMRRFIGHEYRSLMPASMLGGALFMLLVDDLSRTLWTSEVPLGILTAFVGAPFFLYLLLRKEGDA